VARRALLVGINHYAGYIRYNGNIVPLLRHRLYGCINDVETMAALITANYHFAAKEIRELTDACATQAAILGALTELVNSASPGDHLLFYFSGHGSLYSPKPPADNPKRREPVFEILCPYDMDWDQERFISKENLQKIVNLLPDGTALEVVLDACCAGGMKDVGRGQLDALMQFPMLGTPEDLALNGRSRFLVPPPDVLARIVNARDDGEDGIAGPRIMSTLGSDGPKRCIVWASSNDHQSSEEYIPSHGREHGAFTYFFNRVLEADPKAQRAAVLQTVRESLRAERFSQVPGLFPRAPAIADHSFLEPGTSRR
jgi:hypothetical protein